MTKDAELDLLLCVAGLDGITDIDTALPELVVKGQGVVVVSDDFNGLAAPVKEASVELILGNLEDMCLR